MSDLATYKATFKTTNKYLKYFCDKPTSDWTFKKYQKYFSDKDPEKIKKAFMENLQTVKDDSKNVSSIVNRHIDKLLEPFNSASSTSSSSTVSNITVKGNYYNTDHKDTKEIEEINFKQKWVEFLADAEKNKDFHNYKNTYRHLKKQLQPCEASDVWMEAKNYIDDIVAATNIDEFEEKIETNALVPDIKKTCQCINNISMLGMMKGNIYKPYFIPGEDELAAMTVQLSKMGLKEDKRKIYKADGVVRLAELEDLEVLVLETAGAFSHVDHGKTAFDNSKGMFALLAMLTTIADSYKHASVEEFRKLKLYFVQPSGRQYYKQLFYLFVLMILFGHN
ncbi:hypothetical protein CLU79DRAFT_702011 [Phycomyces nitens]|nr:hypothetical protein CLU79DRAFT_702011 [Phycomyces nitens]